MRESMKEAPLTRRNASLASLQGVHRAKRVHDRVSSGIPTKRVATGNQCGREISAGPTGELVATLLAIHTPRSLTLSPATSSRRAERSTDLPTHRVTVAFGHLNAQPSQDQWSPGMTAMMLMTRFTWYFPSLATTTSDITAP